MNYSKKNRCLDDVQIIYLIPQSGETPAMQLNDCLMQLDKEFNQLKIEKTNVIKQTVFLEAGNREDYIEKTDSFSNIINDFYNSEPPASSFIAQTHANGKALSIEVCFLDHISQERKIEHKTIDEILYTAIHYSHYKEIYAAGLSARHLNSIFEQAESSFDQAHKILESEGLSFSDIVRQWNYIEQITERAKDNVDRQNYQVFNDARSRFYGMCDFVNGYPSATGIGTFTGGVTIDFIAISPSKHVKIHPLNNPKQTDAHKYSDKVLVGKGVDENRGKTTPKFERGKLVKLTDQTRIYISGTAAVIGEKTAYPGDVENQTLTTIENMNKLLSPENLHKHGVRFEPSKNSFAYIRTYIKNPNDAPVVKSLCEQNFLSNNFQYLISDICREDLLVEIEGCLEYS